MHITLAMVSSLNGKITDGDRQSHEWASPEDQKHFAELKRQHALIVMGRKTYEASRSIIQLSPNILRVILTRTPKKYDDQAISGQLEFSNLQASKLISSLERRGFANMLLVGGAEVAGNFFREGLIDEFYLTLEPLIFAEGQNLVEGTFPPIPLHLKSAKPLNERGTILLHYSKER